MFFNFDFYSFFLQIIYVYITYLIYLYNYIYVYNILCFLLIILLSLFISYFESDFFCFLILLIETLAFLVIIIFSFFNNSWINTYNFNLNITTIYFILFLVFYCLNDNTYYDIFLISLNSYSYTSSDLNILFVGSFYNSVVFFILLIVMIVLIGILILFLINTINNSSVNHMFSIINFQNNYKQSWRVGSIRLLS